MSKVFLSSSCVNNGCILDAVNTLKHLSNYIELSGGSAYQSDRILELNNIRVDQGLSFLLHNYFPPPQSDFVLNFADTSDVTRRFISNSMRYVHALEIPYYSIHAGFHKTFSVEKERLFNGVDRFNIESIGENIAWFREQFFQTPLAIENLYPNNNDIFSCFGTTVAEIEQIMGYDDAVLLLLDLGHLKISAACLGFDFDEAVDIIFSKYHNRIAELHLSENSSEHDEHDILFENSSQYEILKRHSDTIKKNNINLTIEARGRDLETLKLSHDLVGSLFKETR